MPAGGDDEHLLRRGLWVVWQGVQMEPALFTLAVLSSAVYGAGTAGGGWLLGRLTDDVLTPAFRAGHISGHDLAWTGLSLAGVALLTAIGVVGRRTVAGVVMYRLQARFRRALSEQFTRLPMEWHHRHPAGLLLANASADTEATWQVMAPLPMAIGVLVMLFVAGGAMLLADPVLGAVGLVVLPLVVVANAVYQRSMSPAVTHVQAVRGEVSTVAHESFEAAAVVKSLGREAAETDRFATAADRLRAANVRAGSLRAMFDPAMEAIPTLGTLIVLAVGTWRVASGAADTGDVVQVAYLLSLVAVPLRSIGWVLGELPRTVVGWERVAAVVDERDDTPYGPESVPGTGPVGVRLDGVQYAYAGADGARYPVLHDVSLDVPAGQTIALVGPTGAGKSTIAGLLARLIDPRAGAVEVGGVDLRRLRAGALAEAVALVPQGTFVFHDTVRGNVALGAPDLSDEQIWAALRVARAQDFVAALPDGLDTMIGERGADLSGGQRQRLALARALVRRPRLLILDDATSAVDPSIEAEILAGLGSMDPRDERSTTVVVIAYRRATIALADQVAYIEAGRVADLGPHEELMAASPGYRRLVTAYDRVDTEDAAENAAVAS